MRSTWSLRIGQSGAVTDLPMGEPRASEWWREVLGSSWLDAQLREKALAHLHEVCRGTVKFFRAEKGWGGIESIDTPADVWVWISNIEGEDYPALRGGDLVEFRWKPTFQDSWRCEATWVRRIQ